MFFWFKSETNNKYRQFRYSVGRYGSMVGSTERKYRLFDVETSLMVLNAKCVFMFDVNFNEQRFQCEVFI